MTDNETKKFLASIKTSSDVKLYLKKEKHFFDRDTMKWFGDTMKSFGVKWLGDKRVMYRKPNATVNVFGNWKTCGREFFHAYELTLTEDGEHLNLRSLTDDDTQLVFDTL